MDTASDVYEAIISGWAVERVPSEWARTRLRTTERYWVENSPERERLEELHKTTMALGESIGEILERIQVRGE